MPPWDSQKGVSELQLRPRNGVLWIHHELTLPAGRGVMGSKGLLAPLAVLIDRVGKEEAAPTPLLQNWGRGSTVSSTSEVRQAVPA